MSDGRSPVRGSILSHKKSDSETKWLQDFDLSLFPSFSTWPPPLAVLADFFKFWREICGRWRPPVSREVVCWRGADGGWSVSYRVFSLSTLQRKVSQLKENMEALQLPYPSPRTLSNQGKIPLPPPYT